MEQEELDNLVKKKFKGFAQLPDERVWQSIEASLDKKREKRRIVPIWWRLGGIAAVFALLFYLMVPSTTVNEHEPKVTNVEVPHTQPMETKGQQDLPITEKAPQTTIQNDGVAASDMTIKEASQKRKNTMANTATPKWEGQTLAKSEVDPLPRENQKKPIGKDLLDGAMAAQVQEGSKESSLKQTMPLEEEGTGEETAVTASQSNSKKSILDEIQTDASLVDAPKRPSKWRVGAQVAPVYFDAIGQGSPIDQSFVTNSKSGDINMSYGLSVSYNLSTKLSLRSGINKVTYGYDTDDIGFTSSLQASASGQFANIDYNPSAEFLLVESKEKPLSENTFAASDASAKVADRTGIMSQEMGYLEIPLELDYALVDKRVGVHFLGGISSLVLIDNSVSLTSDGLTTEMGKANNINDFNFSANVGVGINYDFTPKIQLMAEPMFKYQLNTFDNISGDFKPYTIGIYSGIRYKF